VVEAVTRFPTAVAPPAQVVATIRAAQDAAEAGQQLRSQYGMSEQQSEGVLNLSLRRLTSLEARKLQDEADTLNARCGRLRTADNTLAEVALRVCKQEADVSSCFWASGQTCSDDAAL